MTLQAMGVTLQTYGDAREKHVERLGDAASVYGATLAGALSDGKIDGTERAFLERYRNSHAVTAAHHTVALAAFGWSDDDFARGHKGRATRTHRTSSPPRASK